MAAILSTDEVINLATILFFAVPFLNVWHRKNYQIKWHWYFNVARRHPPWWPFFLIFNRIMNEKLPKQQLNPTHKLKDLDLELF